MIKKYYVCKTFTKISDFWIVITNEMYYRGSFYFSDIQIPTVPPTTPSNVKPVLLIIIKTLDLISFVCSIFT